MEQVVENLGEEVGERHAFAAPGHREKTQGDVELIIEGEQDDTMMSQIQQNR